MARLNAAARDAIPASDFADPPDGFPIPDQAHLDAAVRMLPKAADPAAVKARIITIAHRKGLDLPDDWESPADEAKEHETPTEEAKDGGKEKAKPSTHSAVSHDDTALQVVQFSLTPGTQPTLPAPVAGMVRRIGKLFHVGEWADRAFALNSDDMDATVAAFTPVDLEIEHLISEKKAQTIFDGKIGRLQAVWRQGNDLLTAADVPEWVDGIWAEAGRKISAVFDPPTKQLIRAGMVVAPAIPDAALYSAYAVFAGARHNRTDARDLQAIHDLSVHPGGAQCPAPRTYAVGVQGSGWQLVHDLTAQQGACSTLTPGKPGGAAKESPMTEEANQGGTAHYSASPEFQALQAQVAVLKAEARQAKAVTFADSQLHAAKIKPVLRGTTIGLFTQALLDDEADAAAQRTPAVTFGAEGTQTGSRVDALVAFFAAMEPHKLLTPGEQVETIPAGFSAADTEAAAAERRKALLTMTELGRATLAQSNGNGHN